MFCSAFVPCITCLSQHFAVEGLCCTAVCTLTAHQMTGTTAGTFQYAAPEALLGNDVSLKADIYSLGILMHEVIDSIGIKQHQRRMHSCC